MSHNRTETGVRSQIRQFFGLDYDPIALSTLNEKLGIEPNTYPAAGVIPTARYIVIGIGGHQSEEGVDDIPLVSNKIHKTTDAAPFKMLPFALRPTTSDLSNAMRARYCLRTVVNVAGSDYFAYYGRRFDPSGLEIESRVLTIESGVITATAPYVPDANTLSPIPSNLTPADVMIADGDYVEVKARLRVELDASDITEILNASQVLYGSERYAFISELSLCTGADRSINVSDGQGNTIPFNEVIACQVANHIGLLQPAATQRNGFPVTINVGSLEPLYIVSAQNVLTP